ncbi:MAG: CGNR zinc finger domain-containing protein [Actinomycetota bacterium]
MDRAPEAAPSFRFVGGRPCLDLVATLGKRHRPETLERLPDPSALERWRVAGGVLPERPTARPGELALARTLREAIHRLVRAGMDQRALERSDLETVNRWARRRGPVPQLGTGRRVVIACPGHAVTAGLADVARDAVLLMGGPELGPVKECEHPDCSLLFIDRSPSGRRRWCSMESCGNQTKVTGYRDRRRATA